MDHDLDVERDRISAELGAVPRFDRADAPGIRRPRKLKSALRVRGVRVSRKK
jgi:hypothetical protein